MLMIIADHNGVIWEVVCEPLRIPRLSALRHKYGDQAILGAPLSGFQVHVGLDDMPEAIDLRSQYGQEVDRFKITGVIVDQNESRTLDSRSLAVMIFFD
jgi:hypothetical protein